MNLREEHDEIKEMLALHALDMLEPDAAARLEAHLAGNCPECISEFRSLRESIAMLAFTRPLVEPSQRLRERVIALTREQVKPPSEPQVWKKWTPPPAEIELVLKDQGAWDEVHAGIWAKRLHVDTARDQVTMLIRMAPGVSYLPHRHAGPEQCYVLEGDLRDGDKVIRAGDYQCLPQGSVHGAQSTESGCLLLIVSSLRDEIVA